MAKKTVTAKHKDLGIFYTDPAIADFIYSIINIWKNAEDSKTKRWQSNIAHDGKPAPHYPSVIDPAVGEGVFLKEALEKGFTDIHHIFGLDMDAEAVEKWKQIHLLKAFGGNEKDLEAHFFHQNGLDKIKWDQHAHKYYKHLKKEDIAKQQFNLVIGNPPYGGTGLDIDKEPEDFINYLREYEILPNDIKKELGDKSQTQIGIFKEDKITLGNTEKASKRLKSYPIEILFTERFLHLTKPGGWVAIVLPEGIFANSNAHYVREYIASKAKVEAIVSLPRDAFKNAGTNAKTSIIFLRKYDTKFRKLNDYPVFLAKSNSIDIKSLQVITKLYKTYYGDNMTKLVQVINDSDSKELVMARSDKKLSQLMNEKPQSRWDVKYWHPKYDVLSNINFERKSLMSYLVNNEVITNDHFRVSRGESLSAGKSDDFPAYYYSVDGIQPTGYNQSNVRYVSKNGYRRLGRGELEFEDVALAMSGTGSLGKVFIKTDHIKENVCGDLYVLRVNKSLIDPYYIALLLKTQYGKMQIEKHEKGVSGQTKLTADMIAYLTIPVIGSDILGDIIERYKTICKEHVNNGRSANLEKKLVDLIKLFDRVIFSNE